MLTTTLSGGQARALTHAELEEHLESAGRELLRLHHPGARRGTHAGWLPCSGRGQRPRCRRRVVAVGGPALDGLTAARGHRGRPRLVRPGPPGGRAPLRERAQQATSGRTRGRRSGRRRRLLPNPDPGPVQPRDAAGGPGGWQGRGHAPGGSARDSPAGPPPGQLVAIAIGSRRARSRTGSERRPWPACSTPVRRPGARTM